MSFNNRKKLNDGADGIFVLKDGLVLRIDHYDNAYEEEFDEDDEDTYGSLVYYLHAPDGDCIEDFNLLYKPEADFRHVEDNVGFDIIRQIDPDMPGYQQLDDALYNSENSGVTDDYLRIKKKFGLPNKKPKKFGLGNLFRRI